MTDVKISHQSLWIPYLLPVIGSHYCKWAMLLCYTTSPARSQMKWRAAASAPSRTATQISFGAILDTSFYASSCSCMLYFLLFAISSLSLCHNIWIALLDFITYSSWSKVVHFSSIRATKWYSVYLFSCKFTINSDTLFPCYALKLSLAL